MTLRTQFFEFELLQDDQQKHRKIPALIHLFLDVFERAEVADVERQFNRKPLQSFAMHVGHYAVTTIRGMAAFRDTTDASFEIATFFTSDNGAELLRCLHLLLRFGDIAIDPLTSMSLPSTLIKALYLFIDLPERTSTISGVLDFQDRFTGLLHLLFRRKTASLEAHRVVDPETRLSDFSRLFELSASSCISTNYVWRKAAMQTLETIFQYALDEAMVIHTHERELISMVLNEVKSDASLLVKCDVVAYLCKCIAFASRYKHSKLLDDFRFHEGFVFTQQLVMVLDSQLPLGTEVGMDIDMQSDNNILGIKALCDAVCQLVFAGAQDVSFEQSRDSLQDPTFTYPRASGFGKSVRCVSAYHALTSLFFKGNSCLTRKVVMDCIFDIYTRDQVNYFILKQKRTLCKFVDGLERYHDDIQLRFFKLLEYIVCSLNFVPINELQCLATYLTKCGDPDVWAHALNMIIKFVNFNSRYLEIFHELHYVDILVEQLAIIAQTIPEQTPDGEVPTMQASSLVVFGIPMT